MFTQAELQDAINQLLDGKHSIQNCEKLASIYIVLDHLYGENKPMVQGYSNDNKVESAIGLYGDSKFLNMVSGKSARDVWLLMDELVDAVTVFNPRLMNSFYERLEKIKGGY